MAKVLRMDNQIDVVGAESLLDRVKLLLEAGQAVRAFAERRLTEPLPYLILDVGYEKVCDAAVIVSQAVLIAVAVEGDGRGLKAHEVRRDIAAWLAKWQAKHPKLCDWVEENIEETLTYYRLPLPYHKHMKSTNMLELASA